MRNRDEILSAARLCRENGIAVVFDLLDALVGKDPRFLFLDPDRPDRNYNDNTNKLLGRAIREGHRGVY